MRIQVSKVLAHDLKTLGFRVEGIGVRFPVTFVEEDATAERDAARGLTNPADGVTLSRDGATVTVSSERHDLMVELPSGSIPNHKVYGRRFVVHHLGTVDGFELEVS
ncbi:MAG: hypothetical protein U0136_03485 [Bdellovibrionota bacterium]